MALSDSGSLLLAQYALEKLGCPSVRSAEGDSNFKKYNEDVRSVLRTPYTKTPDLIAGPNVGNQLDFYIDVHSPDGSIFKRSKSPLHKMGQDVDNMISRLREKPLGTKQVIEITKYDSDYFPEIANPFRSKINKYGHLRKSHMFGFVTIFDGRDETNAMYVGLALATYADFIFKYLHDATSDKILNAKISYLHRKLHDETGYLMHTNVTIDNYISFYLLVGFGALRQKGLLLINEKVFGIKEYERHPVLQWLRH